MNTFSKKFTTSLLQELATAPSLPTDDLGPAPESEEGSDAAAFDASLDADTDPSEFGDREIKGAQAEVDGLQAAEREGQTNVINSWISRLHEFTEFLNGTDGDSIQVALANAPCDSLLDNISKSETKKVTRIAQELSALREALKGYATSNEDKTPRT